MLSNRIVTGLIGATLVVWAVTAGGWFFAVAVAGLAATAWHEYCKAFWHKNVYPWYAFGLLFMLAAIGCAWRGNLAEIMGILMLGGILVFFRTIFQYGRFNMQDAAMTVMGMVYIGLAFAHFALLRFMSPEPAIFTQFGVFSRGEALLWVAFLGTWASDTFAFFTGMAFGKHKLCPEISPKKTVEGLIGGVSGTVAVALLLGLFFQISLLHMVFLGILIAGAATVGDLVESAMKRLTGIKDSGTILPGHGGVWDRFDSMLFTVPIVYYYAQFFLAFAP